MSDPPLPPKNRGWSNQEIIRLIAIPTAIVLIVCTFTFGWLVDNATVTPAPVMTVPAVVTQTVNSNEAEFTFAIRRQTEIYKLTDSELISLGRAVCVDLDNGKTPMEAGTQLSQDFSPHDAGVILGQAIQQFCPRHEDTPFN